ncbi:MAG: glycosyl hydrolase [Phycisphaerae bacterium]|jgi:hypothetical protein|nr:glycosyl hydrolase [Phycisphaerae bacterium]
MRRILVVLLGVLIGIASVACGAGGRLDEGFADPPDSAKPWAYWWWLDSNVSKAGITADLEAMKKQGIGGALVFDAGLGGRLAADGPVFMSPKWRDHFKFAVKEADRLGLELSLNLCSGWNAGGPWVKPAQAAKRVVWSDAVVQGGKKIEIQLPTPRGLKNNYYRDDAIVAFKIAAREAMAASKLTASSSYPKYPPPLAIDRNPATRWISNGDKPGQGPTAKAPEFLNWEFPAPFPAASLVVTPYSDCGPKDCELQCSDDGKVFRTICKFVVAPRKVKTVTFDETKAKFFRMVVTSSYPFQGKECWNVQISEISLLKKGQKPPSQAAQFKSRDVVDLTSQTDASGKLAWNAPAGAWKIIRMGCTLVGRGVVHCTSPGGGGLEIDPLSRKAMDMHFDATMGKCLTEIGALAGKTLKYTHIDSWELGVPNWTDEIRSEFKRRRGYDPLPYLPVLAGRIVDSKEVSDRFARDYRRTVADCIAENYYGRLSELSREHGMGIHPESGGPFFTHWIDALQCLGKSDIPMGEFWARKSEPSGRFWYRDQFKRCDTVKQAATAAHIYGKKYVQAEAYTTMGPNWEKDPYMLKDVGDLALCSGLTRNMLCFYVHQPYLDIKPGNQWQGAGTHFDRNITWWPMSHAWMKYLARCQFMLQQGLFVADVCYYTGGGVPGFVPGRDHMKPALPVGYDCDSINDEVLLTRVLAKDGRIVLPDGMSYRLLVLPEAETMSIAVLKKLIELSKAGVAIVGAKPLRTPGLRGYPACDQEVKKLASKLKLISPKSIQETLTSMGVGADFESKGATLHYIHRRSKAADIYFVSNQQSKSVSAECAFRVAGRQPELWDAVTGERRDAVAFKIARGRTTVPLDFSPRGSLLVVFRRPTSLNKGPAANNYPKLQSVGEIDGPWTVKFDTKWGGPKSVEFKTLEDWTKRPEKGIKYYSGKATYHKTFDLPKGGGGRLYLDLKRVRNVAQVRLNGKDLGVIWTAPWRVEITKAVKLTGNKLEIDVVNLWPNRLIGDAALPKDKRLTKTNVTKFKANSRLFASGLLGPVTLLSAAKPVDRWSKAKANQWYAKQPWPCGFNYVPANAISYTEMWMPYCFDAKLIDKELALAQGVGFNCLRVVLPFVVWEHDPKAFKKRLDEFLRVCDKRGIKVMFCLFDDCTFGPISDPKYGKQPDVVPGHYANGWTPSPGHSMVRDPKTWPRLEKYVKDVIASFKDDPRVWIWDLYNEPTNRGLGDASLSLVRKIFTWARQINPSQPLTVGRWNGNRKLNEVVLRASDVITFHQYAKANALQAIIADLKTHGRPIICTEWMARTLGSRFKTHLPIFRKKKVGCMHWGLVNGKTQTHYAWGSKAGAPEPKLWFVDLYRRDHTPYDPKEIQTIKEAIHEKRK